MKFLTSTGFAAVLCLAVASCYPYENYEQRKRAAQPPQKMTAEQTRQAQQQALRKKQEEELRETRQESSLPRETRETQSGTSGSTSPPPSEPRRTDYPFANKVPGKDGFVFSPYNNKVVDVREIPSGTLVQDPTYAASEKKYFRVP